MMIGSEDRDNRPRKNGLTIAEREQLRQSYFETKAMQQAESDLALVKAVELGEALKRLKEG